MYIDICRVRINLNIEDSKWMFAHHHQIFIGFLQRITDRSVFDIPAVDIENLEVPVIFCKL